MTCGGQGIFLLLRGDFCLEEIYLSWKVIRFWQTNSKRKSLFKDSAFVNRIAKFCSFKLILCAGIAGELSLIIKDEGCPDDALLLHLPVKSLISYTWVASNLYLLYVPVVPSQTSSLSHMPSKVSLCHKTACYAPRSPGK